LFFAVVAAETPSSEAGRNFARNDRWILPISILSFGKESLTCRKTLRHGDDGSSFPLKEVVLEIFIVTKIGRSLQDLYPRVVGPVASTIKIT
jgi:hypothetical protein